MKIKSIHIITISLFFVFAAIIFTLIPSKSLAASCKGTAEYLDYTASCDYVNKRCNRSSSWKRAGSCGGNFYNGGQCTNSNENSNCGSCVTKVDYGYNCNTGRNPDTGAWTCSVVSNNRSGLQMHCDGTQVWLPNSSSSLRGCSCDVCKPKDISCSGKCGKWSRGCGKTKDCGGCSSGYSCKSGYCKKDPVCNPKSCDSNDCGTHDNRCGSTIPCGPCQSGYSCKGKNSNGRNGECKKDPDPTNPPKYTINVLVFYDKYGNGLKKGSEPAYNVCYPATNASGSGPGSGQVTVALNGGKGVNKTMYKNCRRDGKANNSQRGFTLTSSKKCNTVSLISPTNQTYKVTGYNYSISGEGTRVVTSGTLRKTQTICGNATVRFGVERVSGPTPTPEPVQVTGFVFLDDNGNGRYEPGSADEDVENENEGNSEVCLNTSKTGLSPTIRIGSTNYTWTSKANCSPFTYNKPGTQTVSITAPTGYEVTGYQYVDSSTDGELLGPFDGNSRSLSGDAEILFGIRPTNQAYTISGHIFIDENSPFKKKSNGDVDYTGGTNANRTITITNNDDPTDTRSVVQPANSSGYTIPDVEEGSTYSVSYSGLPSGYEMSFPLPGTNPPPKYTVTVGQENCSINGETSINEGAACSNGDITNLNFAISTIGGDPWYQTVGGDLRDDSNLTNIIPSSNYASAPKLTAPVQDPGLVFHSSTSFNLGGENDSAQRQKASNKGWLAIGKKFKPAPGAGIRATESYSRSVITRGGQNILSLFSGGNNENYPCAGPKPSCNLPSTSTSTFTQGTYTSNGGLTINSSASPYNFANGKKFVFLVQGDIRINRDITVTSPASATFIATRDIIIDGSVSEIAGFYSAGRNFIVEDGNGGTLNVNGAVVANANLSATGRFINDRSLGTGAGGDGFNPSVKFNLTPSLILNAPNTLKVPSRSIAEVAPGPIGSSIVGNLPSATPTNTPTPIPTNTPTPIATPTNTPTPTSSQTVTAYEETNGTVSISAASTFANSKGSNGSGFNWENRTSPLTGTSTTADGAPQNNSYIQARPTTGDAITGGLPTSSPFTAYRVCINTTGNYRIYFRGSGPDSISNQIGVGINNTTTSPYNNVKLYTFGDEASDWRWTGNNNDGTSTVINISSAGLNTLYIWMREPGARIDKIYMNRTTNGTVGFLDTSNSGPAISDIVQCPSN